MEFQSKKLVPNLDTSNLTVDPVLAVVGGSSKDAEWESQRAIEGQREKGRDPVRVIWKACHKKEASLTFLA